MIDNEIEDIDNDEIIDDNEEIAEDIEKFDPSDIVVYSRDWTIETIQAQIKGGNIDLNPNFQRRNAWSDDKRSKLIESILIGYPVPEIVLAEDPKKKKAFIVIDGKQRLLTIAGFIDHATFNYWNTPKLKKLKVRDDLEGLTYEKLSTEPVYSDEFREFQNSSLRCTVITNFSTTDVLYDIFYRLNSGSVPLATQELRQVLNKGEFANYLIDITNTKQPIHDVLNLKGPDKRLKDIEIILRLIAFRLFAKDYTGNLKNFLDDKMAFISVNWSDYKEIVEKIYQEINATIVYLTQIFGAVKKVGRKATNSVIFEVEIFYFSQLDRDSLGDSSDFISNYIELSSNDVEFRNSVESSTKKIQYYQDRYQKFQNLINDSFGISTDLYPFN